MNNAQIESLINGLQFTDPRTAEVLRLLNRESQRATAELDARLNKIEGPPSLVTKEIIPPDVENFQVETRSFSVHFSFDRTTIEQRAFEIRVGTSWDNSQRVLTTSSLSFDIDPIPTGNYIYFIKAISVTGNYSTNAAFAVLSVTPPTSVIVSATVIDNNVLLSWVPSSGPFQIDYYEVLRNGVEVGQQGSTFFVIFEPLAGTYTYTVTAVDIAGNKAAPANITVIVSMPPDYEVKDVRVSDFPGTKIHTGRFAPSDSYVRLLATIKETETWQQHFTSNSWNSPQDQINAGYPFYAQPTANNGSYEEVIDYGLIYTNVLVTVSWNLATIAASMSLTLALSYSSDGVSYSAPVSGTVVYAVSIRYLKIHFDFVAT